MSDSPLNVLLKGEQDIVGTLARSRVPEVPIEICYDRARDSGCTSQTCPCKHPLQRSPMSKDCKYPPKSLTGLRARVHRFMKPRSEQQIILEVITTEMNNRNICCDVVTPE